MTADCGSVTRTLKSAAMAAMETRKITGSRRENRTQSSFSRERGCCQRSRRSPGLASDRRDDLLRSRPSHADAQWSVSTSRLQLRGSAGFSPASQSMANATDARTIRCERTQGRNFESTVFNSQCQQVREVNTLQL